MSNPLDLLTLDARSRDIGPELDALRKKLSPRGDVVSQRGREKTIEVFGEPLTPQQVVAKICADVQALGLKAVLDYTQKLDGVTVAPEQLRVSADELAAAHAAANAKLIRTVRRIRNNIEEFQRAILHADVDDVRTPGIRLRQRYLPLARAGLCVPGGAAAYPSTVLMTAVPALVAGVKELAVVAPPTKFGANNPDVLAVCHELGVREVYRVGGAQGVAALAYGVDGLPAVDKIVGPGNLFVALAKQHVFGHVDIDSIAGPSEVVVIADQTTRPAFTAADMLAQAEHAPGASILITWDEATLQATREELVRQAAQLSRGDLARQSLASFGALILVNNEQEACRITNQLAPEHLHVAIENAERLLDKLHNAGAIFLGNFTPVALGDYVAGPSHVLPTGGTARWASGLSANDFLRSNSVISYSPEGLASVADDVRLLADKEGLTAHRASVDVRLS